MRESILTFLAHNPDSTIQEIGDVVGILPGENCAPLGSQLNRILVFMRDAGEIVVQENEWGGPRFSIHPDLRIEWQ